MRSDLLFRPLAYLAVATAAMAFAPARSSAAEFAEGMKAYEAKDFAAARAVFLDLAELGDGPSQYDLGAMALKGEGVPRDRGEAAGWLLAARENGHDPTPHAVDGLVAKLDPVERQAAERIVARFGRAAMERTVLPGQSPWRQDMQRPEIVEATPPRFPAGALGAGAQGVVIVAVVLGTDGRPRDPEVLMAAQSAQFSAAQPPMRSRTLPEPGSRAGSFVEEVLRVVLDRRYRPARLGDEAFSVNFTFWVAFRISDSRLVERGTEERLLAAASGGDHRAQFLVGVLRLGHPKEPGLSNGYVLASAQAGLAEAQLMVGTRLLRAGEPSKALPWLERASRAGLAPAHVRYGLALFEQGETTARKVHDLLLHASEGKDRYAARHAIEALACANAAGVRDPQAALSIAERAHLDDDTDPLSRAAVAAAQASAGDRAAAVRSQGKAISLAKRLGWSVDELEKRLTAYEAGHPCESPFLPQPGLPLSLDALDAR